MLIRGVVAAVFVVRKHSKITSIVFLFCLYQFVSTPLSLVCASRVATELRIHSFTVFRVVLMFVVIFRQVLFFKTR